MLINIPIHIYIFLIWKCYGLYFLKSLQHEFIPKSGSGRVRVTSCYPTQRRSLEKAIFTWVNDYRFYNWIFRYLNSTEIFPYFPYFPSSPAILSLLYNQYKFHHLAQCSKLCPLLNNVYLEFVHRFLIFFASKFHFHQKIGLCY